MRSAILGLARIKGKRERNTMKNEWLVSLLGEGVTLTEEQDNAIAKHIAKSFVSKNDFNDKVAKLNEAQAQMEGLQQVGANAEELQKKFNELQAANAKAAAEAFAKDTESRIMRSVLKAGARDENAVRAMLDMSKIEVDPEKGITGLDEQLETLQKEKAWAFSTGEATSRVPAGSTPKVNAEEDVDGYMNTLIRGN